ncbi:MAG: hypothetical protein AAF358_04690 [Pseudomonadota bacterium]
MQSLVFAFVLAVLQSGSIRPEDLPACGVIDYEDFTGQFSGVRVSGGGRYVDIPEGMDLLNFKSFGGQSGQRWEHASFFSRKTAPIWTVAIFRSNEDAMYKLKTDYLICGIEFEDHHIYLGADSDGGEFAVFRAPGLSVIAIGQESLSYLMTAISDQ